jgi:hypothetical protein
MITIGMGLFSRQIPYIPLFLGDVLYAVMMYLIARFIFTKLDYLQAGGLALVLTFTIEFSQLCQYDWLIAIRSTLIGRLVLGQGFLYSDLLAYTGGIILVMSLSKIFSKFGLFKI